MVPIAVNYDLRVVIKGLTTSTGFRNLATMPFRANSKRFEIR